MQSFNFTKGRRLRMFAGPNGSGKSTVFENINKTYDVGYYINPDIIQKEIQSNKSFNVSKFGLPAINTDFFNYFLTNHPLKRKASEKGHTIDMDFFKDEIVVKSFHSFSYEAALIADFLRQLLIEKGSKLSFETVMSHSSKIDVLDLAAKNGYKNYLYFICTESPKINIDRVESRVLQGGHYVDPKDVEQRYFKALNQLKAAIKSTHRAYIYDNSGTESKLILEVFEGKTITVHNDSIPGWVDKYLLS